MAATAGYETQARDRVTVDHNPYGRVDDDESGKRNGDGGVPHMFGASIEPRERRWRRILRKEVIQPQVPLRLPCYDFTPVADPTVDACPPCGLAQRLRVEPTLMV